MRASQCRSCSAGIVWAITEQRQVIPMDATDDSRKSAGAVKAEPRPDGNVVYTGKTGTDRNGALLPEVRVIGDQLALFDAGAPDRYVSHFATCPDSAVWRRSKDALGMT